MNFSRNFYQAARMSRDAEVLLSGNPVKIMRRIKNKLLWRLLARAGVWRMLWS